MKVKTNIKAGRRGADDPAGHVRGGGGGGGGGGHGRGGNDDGPGHT